MEKNIHFSSIDTLDMYKEAIFKNQNTNRSTNGTFSFKRFSWIFRTCLILLFCIYGEQIYGISDTVFSIPATPNDNGLKETSVTFVPQELEGKFNTGVISTNFYFYSKNKDIKGGAWMLNWTKFFDKRTDEEVMEKEKKKEGSAGPFPSIRAIKLMRRSIAPGAMVSLEGDLYTVSLTGFGESGPVFQLTKFCYLNSEISKEGVVEIKPWSYSGSYSATSISYEPDSTKWNPSRFHHRLSPCILQEREDVKMKMDSIKLFFYRS